MKHREPNSIEDAVMTAGKILDWDGLAGVVGYSTTLVRAWSDDADSSRKISLDSAIAVDLACLAADGTAPFYRCYTNAIENAHRNPSAVVDPKDTALAICSYAGALAGLISEATDPDGPGGSRFTPQERRMIADALKPLFSATAEMTDLVKTPRNNVHKIGAA